MVGFLGGSAIGVARTETAFLLTGDDAEAEPDPAELAADHPFTIVCAVHAEHHPGKAKGMAGQHVLHESASVNFSLAAYIRELGYRATVRPVDSAAAARAAGPRAAAQRVRRRCRADGPSAARRPSDS